MHLKPHDAPVDAWAMSEAETVALAYLQAAKGDRRAALLAMATDALTDRDAMRDRLRERGRQISHGYVRGALDG